MKVVFRYFRIPASMKSEIPRKGIPDETKIKEYVRSSSRFANPPVEEDEPYARGGSTECNLFDDKNRCIGWGVSICSLSDSFCYKIGRDISYGRAMKMLEETT